MPRACNRAVLAVLCLLACGGLTGATAGEREGDRRPLTSLPVRDGAVIYVRYGTPGGVQITSHFTATDSVPADSLRTPAHARAAAPALAPAAESGLSPDLAAVVRRIIREEMARQPSTATLAAPVQPVAPPQEQRDLLDAEVGAGFPERAPDTGDPAVRQGPGSSLTVLGEHGSAGDGTTPELVAAAAIPTPQVVREQIASEGLFRTNLILFEFAEDRLFPRSREVIRVVGEVLREFPEARIRIEGHADQRGPEDYNQLLSQRRAETVRQYLLDCCGLEPQRLEAVGYGESRPLVSGTSPTELAMNRRVEFRILNPEALRREVERGGG